MLLLFTALFSLMLLLSANGLLKRLGTTETVVCTLFNSFLCQHINFKIFSAYDRLSIKEEWIPRIVSNLHFGLLLPLLLTWVAYLFCSGIPTIYRLAIAMCWVGIDVVGKYVLLKEETLLSGASGWYPIIDVSISVGIVLLAFIFMNRFSSILRKEIGFIE
ncbi:hypothetical protein KYJ26_06865 [Bacillus sp. MCCB 382]|uniref:hypothetical protein n=1 Tax=Bacillus sp. MCCB 382 TaxID=2860197 RepID=UPI001C57719F|nr:hypothetical protein [Bacillus sp. MCCB 382]